MNLLAPHLYIQSALPKAGYVIKTVTMLGDADYYIPNELYLDEEDFSQELFIKIFDACLEVQKNPNYNLDSEVEDDVRELIASCPFSGELGHLDVVDMFYYDNVGNKLSVNFL